MLATKSNCMLVGSRYVQGSTENQYLFTEWIDYLNLKLENICLVHVFHDCFSAFFIVSQPIREE